MVDGSEQLLTVDAIYVVNLASRSDRWTQFDSGIDLWEEAFGAKPQRFDAIAGCDLPDFGKTPWFTSRVSALRDRSWGGKAGCILSHAEIIRDALAASHRTILVLEDDAYITKTAVETWKDHIAKVLENIEDTWISVSLCTAKPVGPLRRVAVGPNASLVEATGTYGTVAYLLNGKYLSTLSACLPTKETIWPWVARHKTIDRWFSRNLMRFGECYLVAPSLVGHHDGVSDITPGAVESISQEKFALNNLEFVASPMGFFLRRRCRLLGNLIAQMLFGTFRFVVKRVRGL